MKLYCYFVPNRCWFLQMVSDFVRIFNRKFLDFSTDLLTAQCPFKRVEGTVVFLDEYDGLNRKARYKLKRLRLTNINIENL